MYVAAWHASDHVVLSPASPEHLVAAGILAAALGQACGAELGSRPAPVLVAAPIREAATVLQQWMALPRRPRLWIIVLDQQTVQEWDAVNPQGRGTALSRLRKAGAEVLIAPEEVEPNPVSRVEGHLQAGIGLPVDGRWTSLMKTARRRTQAVRRALHPPLDARIPRPRSLNAGRKPLGPAANSITPATPCQ